jgi:hypothetical protein
MSAYFSAPQYGTILNRLMVARKEGTHTQNIRSRASLRNASGTLGKNGVVTGGTLADVVCKTAAGS